MSEDPDDDDGFDPSGKEVTFETLKDGAGVLVKFYDGKPLIRVYTLSNQFNSLLIPRQATVRVRGPLPGAAGSRRCRCRCANEHYWGSLRGC